MYMDFPPYGCSARYHYSAAGTRDATHLPTGAHGIKKVPGARAGNHPVDKSRRTIHSFPATRAFGVETKHRPPALAGDAFVKTS
jgi:hypothetical protein